MVNEFVETTQNTNKTQLLASNEGTFRALVISWHPGSQRWDLSPGLSV
jgi:hypothetical protein